MSDRLLIEATDLVKHFPVTKGIVFSSRIGAVHAVDGVSFRVHKGETLGVIGESGSGKSTVGKMILRLERPTGGSLLFRGKDVAALDGASLKDYRRSVQAVFQDPYSSLNPRMRVADILAEPVVNFGLLPRKEIRGRILELAGMVGLPGDAADRYSHQFSGGQRQRVAIARALIADPELIVLDEPVSALDVSIRAQILNLLRSLQRRLELTYFLISHDLAAVYHLSDHICVMYSGKLLEVASKEELASHPGHPYTQALISVAKSVKDHTAGQAAILPGEVPSPLNPPDGCRFHPRCRRARKVCFETEPLLREVGAGHYVACGQAS